MDYKAITTLAFMVGMTPSFSNASGYTLQPLSTTRVNGMATSVVVDDFNADGRKDVVVLSTNNRQSHYISVFLQDASGGLSNPTVHTFDPARARDIAVSDLNNDGFKDFIVAHADGVTMLTSNGSGGFLSHSEGGQTWTLNAVTADFDKDGNVDVASIDDLSDITVLFGDGQGGVLRRSQINGDASVGIDLQAGDLNGDTWPDLAFTDGDHGVYVVYNNGGSGFQTPVEVSDKPANNLVVADIDGSGNSDLAATGSAYANPKGIFLFYQRNTGQLYLDHTLPTNGVFGAISAADLDKDGTMDIFAPAGAGRTSLEYYLQSSPAVWVKREVAIPDAGYDVAAGDLDGDGCTDVAIADYYAGLVLLKGRNCVQ
ncbi:FG-GAP repeat domain-containing protein [Lysobacter sp. CA199]|uniref:FG-GAP repeat domain-containing protein n=1 Tax=Lysobacter sp. CA199 TaxID=3455608 RepID=UPI003F8D6B63